MVYRWKEDHTPLVLELLREHECLWNTKNIDYRNKVAREAALHAVVRGLNLPVTTEDIKLKIKTIRTRYSSELSKVQRAERDGANGEGIYVPKLSWYKLADSFLRAVCVPRSRGNSGCYTSNQISHPEESVFVEIHDDETYDYDGQTTEGNTNTDDDGDFSYENMMDDKQVTQREIQQQNMIESEPRVRGVKRLASSDIPYNSNAIVKQRKLSEDCSGSENEFDLFCKSLAVQLKNMPLQRALVCQQQLQQVMTNERLFQLSNSQFNTQNTVKYSLQTPSLNMDSTQSSSHLGEDTTRNNLPRVTSNHY